MPSSELGGILDGTSLSSPPWSAREYVLARPSRLACLFSGVVVMAMGWMREVSDSERSFQSEWWKS